MKNLLIMGPPGAGKGTQAAIIREKFNIPHISTGDMFREAIKNETPLGVEAKSYLDQGKLVPDEVTVGIVRNRLQEDDCKNGFLLDGFPRTMDQAISLDQILNDLNAAIDYVINVTADNNLLVKRLVGRRICKECGDAYHLEFNKPSVDNICNTCNGELYQRTDDTVEKAEVRLNVYENQTKELINYYSKMEKLVNIDGVGSIEEIYSKIEEAIK